jgi:hypothetical protein
MAVFSGYTIMGQNQLAATLFGFTDIIHVSWGGEGYLKMNGLPINQYVISTCACGVALWRFLRMGGGGEG